MATKTEDPKLKSKADEEKEERSILDALERESKEFDKDAEIDRILHAFSLDAYAVLDLQPGVPTSEIKLIFRKKSLLIHPDKTTNPSAPAAFDKLKKAEGTLMDEKSREKLDEAIADARHLLMRAHKFTADSPEMKAGGMSEDLKVEWRKKTVEVLVDNEARRRKQVKAQMQEEGREQRKVEAEEGQRKRRREHEVAWEQTREKRIDSWRTFATKGGGGKEGGGAGSGGGGGERKKKKMKVLG